MGDGGQMFSWVHVADFALAIDHIHDHHDISGPVNVATLFPVTNDDMMREVRATLGRRYKLLDAGVPILARRTVRHRNTHSTRTAPVALG